MNIFVSRPNNVEKKYEKCLSTLNNYLISNGITPRTLGQTDEALSVPLEEVIEIINECDGAIVLGVPQITINDGKFINRSIYSPLELPTEWNHIEAALAYEKKIPLLVIRHPTVDRGIFKQGTLNRFIHEYDFSKPEWIFESSFNNKFKKWKEICCKPNTNIACSTINGEWSIAYTEYDENFVVGHMTIHQHKNKITGNITVNYSANKKIHSPALSYELSGEINGDSIAGIYRNHQLGSVIAGTMTLKLNHLGNKMLGSYTFYQMKDDNPVTTRLITSELLKR